VGGVPLFNSRYETERIRSDELTEMTRILHRRRFFGNGKSGLNFRTSLPPYLSFQKEEGEEEVEI
jgi:hypothetical protein